jgi:hypothetical protein
LCEDGFPYALTSGGRRGGEAGLMPIPEAELTSAAHAGLQRMLVPPASAWRDDCYVIKSSKVELAARAEALQAQQDELAKAEAARAQARELAFTMMQQLAVLLLFFFCLAAFAAASSLLACHFASCC